MFIALGIIGFIALVVLFSYNALISRRNAVENAFGSIDVMLKKRYDLIPNLLETAKAYMKHEKETFASITEMRTRTVTGNLPAEEKVQLENLISGMMKNVMVAVESYPELKASEQFTMLQRSWNETEEQISAARRSYNAAVTSYNNAVEQFPSSIFASMFGHKRKSVFVTAEAERQNISAKDMFNS